MPQDSERAVRLRPEEILAKTFTAPLSAESNDAWSPRGRRIFLVALAVAGILLVVTGLVLTGQLGPGPGGPQPLGTAPDVSGLGAQLLPQSSDQATPAGVVPTTAAPPTVKTGPPVVTPTTRTNPTAAGASNPAPAQAGSTPSTQPGGTPSTTTTLPCSLLGSRSLGAQVPPLCR